MPRKSSEIKANSAAIVFVTHSGVTEWLPDPDRTDSVERFLGDCRAQNWPIWYTATGPAYVFATGRPMP